MGVFFKDSSPKRAKKAGIRPVLHRGVPAAKPYVLLTPEEIYGGQCGPFVCDVECYPNYFLVGFKCLSTGKVFYFEDSPSSTIDRNLLGFILFRYLIITFFGKKYDLPMLAYALDGVPAWKLKEHSNELILSEEPVFDMRLSKVNHIDLFDVAPLDASLKIYGGRLHCPRMQDLPYADNHALTEEEARNVRDYNLNDLDITELLYNELKPHIDLRILLSEEYGMDMRSKSDAQIGEQVMLYEMRKLGAKIEKPTVEYGLEFGYVPPSNIVFQTQQLKELYNNVCNSTFVVGDNGKSVFADNVLGGFNVLLGGNVYKFRAGGLHSSEKSVSQYAGEDLLCDTDIASNYPFIILNNGYYPAKLGPAFLDAYRGLVYRRLDAKAKAEQCKLSQDHAGAKFWKNIADILKIAINGIYGKLGDLFSKLYSHNMTLQVCLSGQFYLLMLIEAFVINGFQVVSANTDGVVTRVPKARKTEFDAIVKAWEAYTSFETEETFYSSIHCRDVNNYIAMKPDGTFKTKGVYAEVGSALNSVLSKNPESLVVSKAVQAHLLTGKDVREFIRECEDMRWFVNIKKVVGGGYYGNEYLGKAVRWYYSTDSTSSIRYTRSTNQVGRTEGCKPCMDLPDFIPEDLDFDYYVSEAWKALYQLGIYVKPGEEKLL